jgi:hypothetical protein
MASYRDEVYGGEIRQGTVTHVGVGGSMILIEAADLPSTSRELFAPEYEGVVGERVEVRIFADVLGARRAAVRETIRATIDGSRCEFFGDDWGQAWGAACAEALSLANREHRDISLEELAPDGTRCFGAKATAEPHRGNLPGRIVPRR